ncbi:GTP cyclohydrolase IIa [Pseudalkalibacillus decolorationis]|uniref:GTP cyclohydrolase IIa n=1 Tax=Pseudalkalibacillus decolorationis TaxID=163879 RepID=UPI0021475C65|nr:GTP cyclohydrolase IIa [Pseudalkalibacillus decolorationis]
MKIAIVGPEDSLKQAISIFKDYKIEYETLLYDEHNSIIPMIKKIRDKVDGFLFTGVAPYQIAKNSIDLAVPIKYVQHDITTLYRTLFNIRYVHNLKISQLSIDVFKPQEVKEVFEELDLPFENIHMSKFNPLDADEITRFHMNLYQQGKVNFCITSLLTTLNTLRREEIPCFRVVPSKFALRKTLELLILEITSLKTQEAQISVGIFHMDNIKSIMQNYSEYKLQSMKLKLYDLILKYGAETQSSVVFSGGNEFIIYGTMGKISKGLNDNEANFLLEQIRKTILMSVSYGIGEGLTANEATNNARIALKKSKEDGGNCAYIRKINGTMIGPLGDQNEIEYITGYDEKIEQISQEVGISSATLSKIQVINKKIGKGMLSANELSEYYGCSLRSARRLLSMLEKSGYASIVSYDQPFSTGRPRRYYELSL